MSEPTIETARTEVRAWLEANWDDLSHGRLTLEDLP